MTKTALGYSDDDEPIKSGYIPDSIQSFGGDKISGTQMSGERAMLTPAGGGLYTADSSAVYGPNDTLGFDQGSTGDGFGPMPLAHAVIALEGVYGRNPGTNTELIAQREADRRAVRRADQLAADQTKARQFPKPPGPSENVAYQPAAYLGRPLDAIRDEQRLLGE